ncbi:MAG: 4-hydroxy-3-methylbut-2-enyl diphosphate reductase [Verrucomicrobiota bacterium]
MAKKNRVNVRTPEVMNLVEAEVSNHYQSSIVEGIRALGGNFEFEGTSIALAKQFGFCYGVERAIDLAYASRRVFPDNRIFLIGEIIHNPEVNAQLRSMDIVSLPWKEITEHYDDLGEGDVVIVPAFGAPVDYIEKIESQGASIVDTTCGDVMKVWRRVKNYAKAGVTSIIHGKAGHEETRATASRALGPDKDGNYLVVLTLDDVDYLCDYIVQGGDKVKFLERFSGAYSNGFDPEMHLTTVGVANQTTMLKSETEEIQKRVADAIKKRDGNDENYQVFDTICGATQERQDALFEMLEEKMDLLLVVGGYNSSNTAHLVEIGEKEVPTFFIRDAGCLESLVEVVHFDLHQKAEVTSSYPDQLLSKSDLRVGITAGASCPNNLIENTILKVFELRGTEETAVRDGVAKSYQPS